LLRRTLEAAVVVVFALLIWNNFALRRQTAHAAAAFKSARAFAVHDSFGALPVTELTGARATLPIDGRIIVAIVDPQCDSCRALLADIRPDSGIQVLSVAPLPETTAMARNKRLTAITHVIETRDPKLQIYPQLFVVEGGKVVRTCATVAECVARGRPAR
jgi:hypothetical protein